MNKSSFEQNCGSYRMVGDYKIPNITLPAEARKPLGIWGLKRKDYSQTVDFIQTLRLRFDYYLELHKKF